MDGWQVTTNIVFSSFVFVSFSFSDQYGMIKSVSFGVSLAFRNLL